MTEREYRRTLFDRYGPDAGLMLRAAGYGVTVFGSATTTLLLHVGLRWWVIPAGAGAGVAVAFLIWSFTNGVGGAWEVLFVRGQSTPYVEQYSYQQSLVMSGKVDEALESFEAIVAEHPETVAPHIKAAELYVRERQNHRRAAELLRAAQRSPLLTTGDEVYITHRLVDLYTGPLGEPGRAMVELRRLIDRHPDTSAATRAREALQAIKARAPTSDPNATG